MFWTCLFSRVLQNAWRTILLKYFILHMPVFCVFRQARQSVTMALEKISPNTKIPENVNDKNETYGRSLRCSLSSHLKCPCEKWNLWTQKTILLIVSLLQWVVSLMSRLNGYLWKDLIYSADVTVKLSLIIESLN